MMMATAFAMFAGFLVTTTLSCALLYFRRLEDISCGDMAKACVSFTHECAIGGTGDGIFTAAKEQLCVMAAPEECSPFFDARNGRVARGKRTPDTPPSKASWTAEKNVLAAPAAYNAAAWTVGALLWAARRRAKARRHAAADDDIASGLLIAADGAADSSHSARGQVPETPSDHLMAGFLASLTESAHIDEEVVRLGPRLGTGGTADVFALEFLQDDHRRASKLYGNGRGFVCKKIKKDVSGAETRVFKNEIAMLQRTNDQPGLVRVVSTSATHLTIVMERLDFDLQACLERPELLDRSSQAELMQSFGGVVDAVIYLHEVVNVVHGDLKPENIFVHSGPGPCVLKLGDLGFASDMGTLAQGYTEEYFPPEAMATVVGKADRQSFKVGPPMDIFATGLIAIQLLCRSPKPPTAPGVIVNNKSILFPGEYPLGRVFERCHAHTAERRRRAQETKSPEAWATWRTTREHLHLLYLTYGGQEVKTGDTRNTVFSPVLFKPKETIPHFDEVVNVLMALTHEDPERRLALRSFRMLLAVGELWAAETPRGAGTGLEKINKILEDTARSLDDGRPRAAWIRACIESDGVVWWHKLELYDDDDDDYDVDVGGEDDD